MRKFTLLIFLVLLGCERQQDRPVITSTPPPTPTGLINEQLEIVPPAISRQIDPYLIEIWNADSGVPTHLIAGMQYGYGIISAPGMEPIIIQGAHDVYPLPAVDVTGEGEPDILIQYQDGGSHCCRGYQLFNLGSEVTKLLTISGGSGWIGGSWLAGDQPFRDLNNDGRYEIIGREGFPNYRSESPDLFCSLYTAQMVLTYENGRYLNAGALYPEIFVEEIASRQQGIEERIEQTGAAQRCSIIELTLSYHYAGQADAAWAAFDKYYVGDDKDDVRAGLQQLIASPDLFISQQ